MSFLDNLENNLKSLESQDQAHDGREHVNRAAERTRALAAAPWADRLKNGPFTSELLRHATRLGFAKRTKVRMSWIGTTLRLEAGERRMDLQPTADGVVAAFSDNQNPVRTLPVDLDGSAEDLASVWLS